MEEIKRTEKLLRDIKIRNTHKYWTILIISKKDDHSDREIILESLDYTLPDIKYKDDENYKKLVVKEFNQNIREKYKPGLGYRVSPILMNNLYLTLEEAEKVKKDMIERDKTASRKSK